MAESIMQAPSIQSTFERTSSCARERRHPSTFATSWRTVGNRSWQPAQRALPSIKLGPTAATQRWLAPASGSGRLAEGALPEAAVGRLDKRVLGAWPAGAGGRRAGNVDQVVAQPRPGHQGPDRGGELRGRVRDQDVVPGRNREAF